MITIATNFIHYLNFKEIDGYKKVKGFIIEENICVLQFYILPSIKEWLAIAKAWEVEFGMSISTIGINKIK